MKLLKIIKNLQMNLEKWMTKYQVKVFYCYLIVDEFLNNGVIESDAPIGENEMNLDDILACI